MTRASILAAALKLPVPERAKLISELIATVEDGPEEDPAEVETAWALELEQRIARADSHPDEAIEWTVLQSELKGK